MSRQARTTRSISLLVGLLLVFGSISACSRPSTPTSTMTISKDKAIELAIGYCKIPHLVLVGEPQNIRANLITLEEADQIINEAGESTNYEMSMDTMVWMVQVDGQLQLVRGPLKTEDNQTTIPTPPQPFWGTCSVLLDADSGNLILVRD